jgi:hypothetical protein
MAAFLKIALISRSPHLSRGLLGWGTKKLIFTGSGFGSVTFV